MTGVNRYHSSTHSSRGGAVEPHVSLRKFLLKSGTLLNFCCVVFIFCGL